MRRLRKPEGSGTASAGGDGRLVSGVINPPCYRVQPGFGINRPDCVTQMVLPATLLCARFYIAGTVWVQKTGDPVAWLDFSKARLSSPAFVECGWAPRLKTASERCGSASGRI